MENDITKLVLNAMQILRNLGLKDSTLLSYDTRAFRPIIVYFKKQNSNQFQELLMLKLEEIYQKDFSNKIISRKTFNWKIRGLRIIEEVHETNNYVWKMYNHKKVVQLPDSYENLLKDFQLELNQSKRRIHDTETIIRSFLRFIYDIGTLDITSITSAMVREFMLNMSINRPKSMDKVVEALRKFFRYLSKYAGFNFSFELLLSAPRSRDHIVKPCMKTDEVYQILEKVSRISPIGKRDFAILTFAATTGLRAGDIAKLKLTDIVWQKKELHITQGKTGKKLILPLQKNVMNGLADYILEGRPESHSNYIFLRSYAPYAPFSDGASVSCVFRKYLSKAGIEHFINDGKTLHGMRRMISTQMIISGIPITTVSQVLGHTNSKSINKYISLDLQKLKSCTLPLSSLSGDK